MSTHEGSELYKAMFSLLEPDRKIVALPSEYLLGGLLYRGVSGSRGVDRSLSFVSSRDRSVPF